MPTHTGSSRRPPKNNHTNNNNGNDFKTLKILYRQQLPTLRELFPDWSQEDLVAAMHEANGDLELTIERIMAGHANQWDQVKTKKPKPQQKQHSTGGAVNSNMTKKSEGQNGTRDTTRGAKSRNGRSRVKFGDKTHRSKKEAEEPTKPAEKEEEKKPSWASILKGPPVPEPEPTTTINTTENDKEKALEPGDEKTDNGDDDKHDTTDDSLDPSTVTVAGSTVSADIVEQAQNDDDTAAAMVDNDDDTTNETKDNDEQNEQPIPVEDANETTTTELSQESQQHMSFRKVPVRRLKQDEPVILPGGGGSGLENVSLQFGSLNLANGEEQSVPEQVVEQQQEKDEQQDDQQQSHELNEKEAIPTTTVAPTPVSSTAVPANAPIQSIASSSTTTTTTARQVSKAPDTTVYQQPQTQIQQQPQQPQPEQHVQPQPQPQPQPQQPPIQSYQPATFQPQPQQQLSNDIHSNSYAPYAPNPIPGNVPLHGFTNPGMVAMPDYYGSEVQRPMNYYDPSGYTQSPSIGNAHLYGRGKFNNVQEGMAPSPTTLGIMGSTSSTPVMQVPQQPQAGMYGGGNTGGYYSYYYMPNQYQSYQQTGYQQQPTPHHQYQPQQQPIPPQQSSQQPQPQQVPPQHQPQQQQPQQQPQQQSTQKQPQVAYMNTTTTAYPMYGKPGNSVYQDYTNQPTYDDNTNMMHSNGTTTPGLMYDSRQYQSANNNGLPQIQNYLAGGNMNSQQQQGQQQQVQTMANGNGNQVNKDPIMMNGFDKPGQPMQSQTYQQQPQQQQQQSIMAHGNYQPQYQQYQLQQQQQQQPFLYQQQQQQPYNPSLPNSGYPSRQTQPQQALYWHQV